MREYFAQPVVGTLSLAFMSRSPFAGNFPVSSLLSLNRTVHTIDFTSVTLPELQQFTIDFHFRIDKTGSKLHYTLLRSRSIAMMHGFGCWFDINFIGSNATVVLSTAPDQPGTHWYQVSEIFIRKCLMFHSVASYCTSPSPLTRVRPFQGV